MDGSSNGSGGAMPNGRPKSALRAPPPKAKPKAANGLLHHGGGGGATGPQGSYGMAETYRCAHIVTAINPCKPRHRVKHLHLATIITLVCDAGDDFL